MPRRRKRMTKLPSRSASTQRFDEGYNPGDTGYYPGRAEGKPAPKEPSRAKPKGKVPHAPGTHIDPPPKRPGEIATPRKMRPGTRKLIERPRFQQPKGEVPKKFSAQRPKAGAQYQLPIGEAPKKFSAAQPNAAGSLTKSTQATRKKMARRG